MPPILKDPDSRTEQTIDWRDHRPDAGAPMASSWTIRPAETGGLIEVAARLDGTLAAVTLDGGRPGRVYSVTNRVLFTDGQSDERSLTIRVEER